MDLEYRNKLILAPMVRCGTLAFRLLALEYGADIVYTEEIIDYKMINAKRKFNVLYNTIDYFVEGTKKPVFQTNELERNKVVFQMGTCNAARALEVCKLIENDVAAIDINMGCPKEFSVQGGMGSALLKKPELVKEILTTLVQNCSKPITCKIRCLPTLQETIDFCKMIEDCGVKAIAVHGRFQSERSRHPLHSDFIKEVANALTIPVIANGGSNTVSKHEHIEDFKKECGVSSVMLARVAMWNCSIFRSAGPVFLDDVIKRYLKICLETNNFFFSTKYVVQQMLHEELQSERGIAVLASQSHEEIYGLFGMLEDYERMMQREQSHISKEFLITKRKSIDFDDEGHESLKKNKPDEESIQSEETTGKKIITKHAKYSRKHFSSIETPKSILHSYTIKKGLPRPVYKTEEKRPERVYKCILELNGIEYTTPYWEVNKQATEQAAAIVCLEMLNVDYSNKQTNLLK